MFLIPEEKGLYLPNSEKPVLKDGVNYFYMVKDAEDKIQVTRAQPGEAIIDTIFDIKGNILVHRSQIDKLRPQANVPVVGYHIVETVVQFVLDVGLKWTGKANDHLEDRLEKYFRTDIDWAQLPLSKNQSEQTAKRPGASEQELKEMAELRWHTARANLTSKILEETTHLRRMINDMIHTDEDSEWHVFLSHRTGRDISITKHRDYRVMEWEDAKNSGYLAYLEWKLSQPEGEREFHDWQTKHKEKKEFAEFDKKQRAKDATNKKAHRTGRFRTR